MRVDGTRAQGKRETRLTNAASEPWRRGPTRHRSWFFAAAVTASGPGATYPQSEAVTTTLEDTYWDDYMQEQAEEAWFQERVEANIKDLFDEHFRTIFRANIAVWSEKNWPSAEVVAHRVGTEARAHARDGLHGPAVVWSATCVEIIFRDLTLKPVFTGLFLGGAWADVALDAMLRNRWVGDSTRRIAKDALLAVAELDVDALEANGVRPWNEIKPLLHKRNRIAHIGEAASGQEAAHAVEVAAALYASLLPLLRDLCGLRDLPGYTPPDGGAPF